MQPLVPDSDPLGNREPATDTDNAVAADASDQPNVVCWVGIVHGNGECHLLDGRRTGFNLNAAIQSGLKVKLFPNFLDSVMFEVYAMEDDT